MDDFQRLQHRAYGYLLLANFLSVGAGISSWIAASRSGLHPTTAFVIAGICALTVLTLTSVAASRYILQPLKVVWQAILHVSSDTVNIDRPDMHRLRFGRELVLALTNRVYQLATQHGNDSDNNHQTALPQAISIVNLFPQPCFVLDKNQIVTHASAAAFNYFKLEGPQLLGKKLSENIDLEFSSEKTLALWMEDCQTNKVTDHASWQRVRINTESNTVIKQCDIAAYYNRDNVSGTEFIITLVDRSEAYTQDDEALSFIALAVHELRTPLTMMRGYVEVFEEELSGKLDAELSNYLQKLRISTDQLTSFVTNILNVVRVDENQLSFNLTEAEWAPTLQQAATNVISRAEVLGKKIVFRLEDDLPKVALDPVSITEVINNLLDNALKYSAESEEIVVTSKLNQEGFVETTIQDFGVGIPENVIPNLFEKFYRNHRTRNQFGGTGLGLYLCKAIVTAHGGNISVRSKPGEGSSFAFTLQPYTNLADEQKNSNNDGITRHAHGWIKNHSMYRR